VAEETGAALETAVEQALQMAKASFIAQLRNK